MPCFNACASSSPLECCDHLSFYCVRAFCVSSVAQMNVFSCIGCTRSLSHRVSHELHPPSAYHHSAELDMSCTYFHWCCIQFYYLSYCANISCAAIKPCIVHWPRQKSVANHEHCIPWKQRVKSVLLSSLRCTVSAFCRSSEAVLQTS